MQDLLPAWVPDLHVLFLVGSLFGAGVIITWRMREARSPVTLRKIIIPPLGMSTGFSMFIYPPARVPVSWALTALILGAAVFAYPVIRTSRLTVQDHRIFVKRSPAFMVILIGLIAVRFGLRAYIEKFIGPLQTGGLFFLLAFGMIARWRWGMLKEYRALEPTLAAPEESRRSTAT